MPPSSTPQVVRHSGRSEVPSTLDALTIHTQGQSGIEARRCRRRVRRSLPKRLARDSVSGTPTARPCNCRLNRRVQTRYGRDRLQIAAVPFPGGCGVNRDKRYRRGARTRESLNAVDVRVHRYGRCRPVVDHPNQIDLRDTRAVPMCSGASQIILSNSLSLYPKLRRKSVCAN